MNLQGFVIDYARTERELQTLPIQSTRICMILREKHSGSKSERCYQSETDLVADIDLKRQFLCWQHTSKFSTWQPVDSVGIHIIMSRTVSLPRGLSLHCLQLAVFSLSLVGLCRFCNFPNVLGLSSLKKLTIATTSFIVSRVHETNLGPSMWVQEVKFVSGWWVCCVWQVGINQHAVCGGFGQFREAFAFGVLADTWQLQKAVVTLTPSRVIKCLPNWRRFAVSVFTFSS